MNPNKIRRTIIQNTSLCMSLILTLLSAFTANILVAGGALAQSQASNEAADYPNKPIRFIAPSSVGGSIDVLARMFGAKMAETWGRQVVVDNRAGAGGIIGYDIVAKAQSDGYTIIMAASGYFLNLIFYAKLPYEPMKDFERVSLVACTPNVMMLHLSVPVTTLPEFIAYAKARPNVLNYASAGVGTTGFLSALLLRHLTGIQMTHVPYKGAGDASNAVLVGEVQLAFTNPNFGFTQSKAGRLRMLAVTSPKRLAVVPDLPTMAEAGLPGYDVRNCLGVLTPAKTPRAIINKLNAEIVRILRLPAIRKLLEDQGYEVLGTTPEEYTKFVTAELAKFSKALKELGIKPTL